jgi:anti-anti-sigma regulatory factor
VPFPVAVLRLDGELDLATGAAFTRACAQLLVRDQVKIVVDVRGLGFCDACVGAALGYEGLYGGHVTLGE